MENLKTIQEVLDEINSVAPRGQVHHFNKKKFNELLLAVINDPEYTKEVAKIRKGEITKEEIHPSKEFRSWCKKFLEAAGFDKNESKKVLDPSFKFSNVNGIYELIASVIYLYINEGNSQFDFLTTEEFKGGIYLKDVPESSIVKKSYSPRTREYVGDYEIKKKKHKELKVKGTCPLFLKSRKPV